MAYYNYQLLQKLNEYEDLLFNEPDYLFNKLDIAEQLIHIRSAQDGSQSSVDYIFRGFWRYLTKQYIGTVGRLPSSKILYGRIEEDVNDILVVIWKQIMKNDLQRPLAVQVFTNVKFQCKSLFEEHMFGNRVHQLESKDDIGARMMLEKSFYSFCDKKNKEATDPFSSNNSERIDDCFIEEYIKLIDEVYEVGTHRNGILRMWSYGKIHGCHYTLQHIGDNFGLSAERIRQIVKNFKERLIRNREYQIFSKNKLNLL